MATKSQMRIRTAIRDQLLRWGWDVRRTVNIEEQRRRDWLQREQDKWRFIQGYSPATVLDIGANTGQFAQLARDLLPDVRIISFEPISKCYTELNAKRKQLAPLDVFPFALGIEDATVSMNRNEFSPSSSLLEMDDLHREELPFTAKTHAEEIRIRRLDGLSDELKLADPVFVKIDVQGYTEPVLRGGEKVLRQARAIVAEVSVQPLYHGETTFEKAYEIFTDWGFVYRGNIDQWVSQRDGRILQCDCLFENAHPATV